MSGNGQQNDERRSIVTHRRADNAPPTSSPVVASYGSTDNRRPPAAEMSTPPSAVGRLPLGAKLGYGLGHLHNDLCAGVWFSYTLLFMQNVLGMASPLPGTLIMVGQVGDALATPIVGCLADRYATKRRWHAAGTLLVTLAFPLIFAWCPGCDQPSTLWWRPVYFTVIVLAFQLGWAIVQIAHLAMIPEIARTQTDRSDLTAIRYAASVGASLIVYVLMWVMLSTGSPERATHITPADAFRFRDVALMLTLIGCATSAFFHLSLGFSGYASRRQSALDRSNGRSDGQQQPLIDEQPTAVAKTPRKNFFRTPLLYQTALLYVFSRMFCTAAQIYIPMWLDERSWTPDAPTASGPPTRWSHVPIGYRSPGSDAANTVSHLAIVPLVSFVASFAASVGMKLVNRWLPAKLAYMLGSLLSVTACVWVAWLATARSGIAELCAIALLIGASSSMTMISSMCLTADMIGTHANQSGFIYSAVTFADKLITGIVVMVIDALMCNTRSECPEYYRRVLAFTCGTSAVLGLLTLATMQLPCSQQRARRSSAVPSDSDEPTAVAVPSSAV